MADVTIKYKGVERATLNASGRKTIKTAGKYCEGDIIVDYEKPVVPSSSKTKIYWYNPSSDVSGAKWVTLVENDADLAAHRADSTMTVLFRRVIDISGSSAIKLVVQGNTGFGSLYGSGIRASSSSNTGYQPKQNLTTGTSSACELTIDSNGSLKYYNSGSYPIRAGLHLIIATWETNS